MKRLLLAMGITALCFSGIRDTKAEMTIDFFYNTLGNDGSWVELGNYGYAWQPGIAVSNQSWRPYSDGYWAYTDAGWTWVSYENFGWATYHYGRWIHLRDRGWFWVPGYEWAPAWVSWRTGGDYIGWAPLPPEANDEIVYEGRPVYGDVDVAYDIGPLYYNFVDIRYIGEPVLRERIFDPAQNVTYVERTVNVTNITYNNNVVYNYGPDYNTVSAYSARPIQRLTLQRETSGSVGAAAASGALTKVQGDKLVVAAPPKLAKAPPAAAPKVVKEKIAQPVVEHGWSGIADQKTVAQLKQKMKSENPKSVPPPDFTPRPGESVAAAIAPAPAAAAGTNSPTAASAAVPGASAAKAKGRQQRSAKATAAGVVREEPRGPVNASGAAGKGKGKGRSGNVQPENFPPASRPSEAAPGVPPAASINAQPNAASSEPVVRNHHGEENRAGREAAGGVPPQEPPRGAFSAEGKGAAHRAPQAATVGPEAGPPVSGGEQPHGGKGPKKEKGKPKQPPPGP